MRGRLQRIARTLGLMAFRCPLCGEVGHAPGLCAACEKDLAPRTGGYCPRCGKRFGLNSYEPTTCSDCRDKPPPWNRLHYHCAYGGRVRELIMTYKFSAGIQHARLFQDLALSAFARGWGPEDQRPDIAVPVPLHWRRLLWRGFNQSLELARRLARQENIRLEPGALRRIRNTPPQSTLAPHQREGNLAGAITADPELVRGQRALLVDDVMTTGTTLCECTKALLEAGAKEVDALVAVRV